MNFEVYKKKRGTRSDNVAATTTPTKYPCFELVFNDGWNDYGIYSWFSLWFFEAEGQSPIYIGELKIIDRDNINTFETIPKSFSDTLPDNFGSLGLSLNYYKTLLSVKIPKLEKVKLLFHLRDLGIKPRLREEFSDKNIYTNSLLRDYSSQQALSHARFLLQNRDTENAYSFSYCVPVRHEDESEEIWNVDLPFEANPFQRLLGLVGNNGVGKTYLLRSFARDYLSKEKAGFIGKAPLFDNLFVISSTNQDHYQQNSEEFKARYHLSCLEDGKLDSLLADIQDINPKRTINSVSLISEFRTILLNCIGEEIDVLFKEKEGDGDPISYEVVPEVLNEIHPTLSSGQRHILHMVASLFSHIHMSSFLIIDEPEVHLHPKALMEFMGALTQVLNVFDSFAVIATHSPLIIREIITPNVFIMRKDNVECPRISRAGFDTFGEDISLLYSRIFDYDEEESIFTRHVRELAQKSRTSKLLLGKLEHQVGELNINAKMRAVEIFNKLKTDA